MSRARCASCSGVFARGEKFVAWEYMLFHQTCMVWRLDEHGRQVRVPRALTEPDRLRARVHELEAEVSRARSVAAEERARVQMRDRTAEILNAQKQALHQDVDRYARRIAELERALADAQRIAVRAEPDASPTGIADVGDIVDLTNPQQRRRLRATARSAPSQVVEVTMPPAPAPAPADPAPPESVEDDSMVQRFKLLELD